MSLIIEDYQRLSSLMDQMRQAAAAGEWDNLIALEKRCAEEVATIKPHDTVPSNPDERAQKLALLKKMLANDAEIRSLTESWMEQLQRIMQSTRSEKRLQEAYLANY